MANFPWRLAGGADIDLCGFKRPQLAYRRILWGSNETYIASEHPANHEKVEVLGRFGWPYRQNAWTWVGYENKRLTVEVYSQAQEVELILNGKSLGRKPAGRKHRLTASFELTYEPGTLEAISYTDNKVVSKDVVTTSGDPKGIKIKPDKVALKADGQSLIFAEVEIVDSAGRLVPTAALQAEAEVQGPAMLVAFGTGKRVTEENYTTGRFTSHNGKLLAVVRASTETGVASLQVKVNGLPDATINIKITDY